MIAIALLTVAQGAVSLPVGETLRVELKDVSTTGYRWEARDFDGALVSLEASAVVPSPAGGGAGSAGTSSARAPEHTVIDFVLARPWEKNVQALKQAQVEVTVK